MYAEHVPVIAAAMRADLETFRRGCMFAVLSARQPFQTVAQQVAELERDGAACRFLFGWKAKSFRYLSDHGESLWLAVKAAPDAASAVRVLTDCPGLGLAKAGFVAQLMGYDVACIDSRNIKRDGRKRDDYKVSNKASPRFARALARYVADTGGRSEYYWDVWCEDVAQNLGVRAETVSAMHLAILPARRSTRLYGAACLAIAARLFPLGFDVAETAPETLEAVTASVESGRLTVYSGGSDATIWDDAEVNYAFRAWHDWTHWRYQRPFEGETAVARQQVADLARVYGRTPDVENMGALLLCEVIGQAEYFAQHGDFPSDQAAFTFANADRFRADARAIVYVQ